MATALEFYKTHKVTQQSVSSSTTYTSYLELTVDRSGESGAKNFFVVAHANSSVDDTAAMLKVKLTQDGSTDLGISDGGLTHSDTQANNAGKNHNFIKRVNLDASSHTFDIEFAQTVSDANNVNIDNASIVVIEESANAEYAENETETGTGSGSGWQDKLALSFNPGSTDDYLFIWSCELKKEDESNANILGVRFRRTSGSAINFQIENHSELVNPDNDDLYYTAGGVAFENVATGSTHDYKIQYNGDGNSDETYIRRAYIIAIPFSDFENVYTDSQTSKTQHTGTGWSVSNVDISQSVNAADHWTIVGYEVSAETSTVEGGARLAVDGVNLDDRELNDRDEDSNEYYVNFLSYAATLSSGTRDFELYGSSSGSSASNQGTIRDAYMVVAEIPADAATDITVQDATHSHSADQPTITQTHIISSDDSSHSHSADQPTITQTHIIATDDATHGHTADNVTVNQVISIATEDSTHSHSADEPTITQTQVIASIDSTHSHSADQPAITQTHEISSVDSTHNHSADEPTITQTHVITSDDATHSHTADNTTVTLEGNILVDDTSHSLSSDQPTITQTHEISTNESSHSQAAEQPSVTQTHIISVAEATHDHSADNATASISAINIVVQDATHAHTADSTVARTIYYTYEDITPLPTTASNLGNDFSVTNYSEVLDNDDNFFDLVGSNFLVVMFTDAHENSTDNITVTWRGKSDLAPASSTIYLQIWNTNSSSWETLDSDSTTGASTEIILSGSKTSSLSNYYDTTTVRARIYQEVV